MQVVNFFYNLFFNSYFLILFLFANSVYAYDPDLIQPEISIKQLNSKKEYFPAVSDYIVSSAHPLASEAGYKILKQGGNAIDAAIAVQLVLGLVEPQSSGIGGGGFLLFHEAKTKKIYSYDGRESAPQNIDSKIFQNKNNEKIYFCKAVVGGQSVGVPGIVKLLAKVHEKHGKVQWSKLFETAIYLAENGFEVTPRLSNLIGKGCSSSLLDNKTTQEYFYNEREPLHPGKILTNKDLAKTLKIIAKHGEKAFYQGEITEEILRVVNSNNGQMQLDDFINYNIKEREPICFRYRGYKICSMGPPSSGGIALAQILKILENFDLKKYGKKSVKSWHLIAEAAKLAYADRNVYVADSDFFPVPVEELLSESYLKSRSRLINLNKALPTPVKPGKLKQKAEFKDFTLELPSTSHISIIDCEGNIVSFTSSIEHAFGSNLMASGFLLNNQLTDFSFINEEAEIKIANKIEPGKRPRSSMTPVIVYDLNDNPFLIIGSAGGSRIIQYVAQAIIGVIDWGLSIQKAISLPNLTNNNGITYIERNTWLENYVSPLKSLGHKVKVSDLNSGTNGILISQDKFYCGTDPRREGKCFGR